MEVEQLENIKKCVESMPKIHHIEILRILKNLPNVKLNENKSGVYINLTFLPKETLDEISYYINYIAEQEKTLKIVETQKTEFKNAFFTPLEN
jgi:hypothetical protein